MEQIQRSDDIRTTQDGRETVPPLDSLTLSASVFSRAVSRVTAKQAAAYALTSSECVIIRLLLSGSDLTVGAVARAMTLEIPFISRTVAALVDKGYVSRRRPREDRRKVLLSLTDEGVRLGVELLKETRAYERKVIQDIDPEDLETCLITFGRLVEKYTAWEESGGVS